MSIDISQFHDVFFEESFEGLDVMESGLLALDASGADSEGINTIFRAAHSIKGGAGTFGFIDVSDFTHIIETMLDEMRNGQREITAASTNLLLTSVDVLREMLTAVQQHSETNKVRISEIEQQLQAMMAGDDVIPATETEAVDIEPVVENELEIKSEIINTITGWEINFRPHNHLFQTGNDPVRMFRELATLGDLTVDVFDDKLPPFFDLEPENSYLSWHLILKGDIAEADVVEIFEWVEGDCDLSITAIIDTTVKQPTRVQLMVEKLDPHTEIISAVVEDEVIPEPESNTTLYEAEKEIIEVESPDSDETKISPQASPQEKVEMVTPVVSVKAASEPTATSIRVSTDKVDSLVNMAGELVITQSMLSQVGEDFTLEMLPKLLDGLEQLERNTRDMQEGIMRIRMLPISFAFNRLPRLVHDISTKVGKKVELKMTGEQTEVDKTVIEKVGDPLIHLVRNSLDHGIETPEARLAAGKSETGLLQLKAYQQGGNIFIELHDDGAGLDEDRILTKAIKRGLVSPEEVLSPEKIHDLIFLPGFSTAEEVTDISGRGVGMDVVRKNINSLGGTVDVSSKQGEGISFTIRLPLTLAIMDGQIIHVAGEKYIIPLVSIIETLEVKEADMKRISGKGELYQLGDDYIPVIRLYDVFNLSSKVTDLEEGLLIIVESNNEKVGLFIDDLLGQQQVVIKSLESNYRKVIGISGATILGDGMVAMIIDVPGVVALYRDPSLSKAMSAA